MIMKQIWILLIAALIAAATPETTQACTSDSPAIYVMYGPTSVKYGTDAYFFAIGDRSSNYLAHIRFKIENLDYLSTYLIYYVNGSYAGSGSAPIEVDAVVPLSCNSLAGTQFRLRITNSNHPATAAHVRISIESIGPYGPAPSGGAFGYPTSIDVSYSS